MKVLDMVCGVEVVRSGCRVVLVMLRLIVGLRAVRREG